MLTRRTTLKQIPIMSRLLDHSRMQRIPRRPPLLVLTIAIDNPCQDRLRGIDRRPIRRAREFVDGEGEGEDAEGNVETALVGEGGLAWLHGRSGDPSLWICGSRSGYWIWIRVTHA